MTPARFPHSDTPGSQLGCQLPRAYRRLQRPSSALDAKASTMCPLLLAKQTLNKQHTHTTANRRMHAKTHKTLQLHNPTPQHPDATHPRKDKPPDVACGLMLASTINMTNTKKPTSHDQPIRVDLGLMSQGPTVCQTNQPTAPTPFHAQPKLDSTKHQRPQLRGIHRRFH